MNCTRICTQYSYCNTHCVCQEASGGPERSVTPPLLLGRTPIHYPSFNVAQAKTITSLHYELIASSSLCHHHRRCSCKFTWLLLYCLYIFFWCVFCRNRNPSKATQHRRPQFVFTRASGATETETNQIPDRRSTTTKKKKLGIWQLEAPCDSRE